MARNSTERLGGDYDLEPRGSAVSCTSLTRSQPTFHHLQVWYCADFEGVVSWLISCTAVLRTVIPHMNCLFPRELHSAFVPTDILSGTRN